MRKSELFEGISTWLLERALTDANVEETVARLGRRLVRGGVPVFRINFGSMILHPVLGALDLTWDAYSDKCHSRLVPRSAAKTAEFRNAPFFQMVKNNVPFERHRIVDPEIRTKYPLFESLAEMGITDYVALFASYGRELPLTWANLPAGVEGALASFSTKRASGFTTFEVEDLQSLSLPLALAMKTAGERSLAKSLLETYLGKDSGPRVLDGLVDRGDGWVIDCCLWFSDLRGSTTMATELDIDSYFATINDYFECTADAVLDHGGEVLKLIGDAVMAIFPFEEGTRPAKDMCLAAIMAARDARARLAEKNLARVEQKLARLDFGIGLHAGKVMYGNVGTVRRLDLTVTGSAANEVERLEGRCKHLKVPVLVSEQFKAICGMELVPLGHQNVAGIDEGMLAFTLPEFGQMPPN